MRTRLRVPPEAVPLLRAGEAGLYVWVAGLVVAGDFRVHADGAGADDITLLAGEDDALRSLVVLDPGDDVGEHVGGVAVSADAHAATAVEHAGDHEEPEEPGG